MASPSKAELDALEQARSRLEMALDADENWRSKTAWTARVFSRLHFSRMSARASRKSGAGSSPSSRVNPSFRWRSASLVSSPGGSFRHRSIFS